MSRSALSCRKMFSIIWKDKLEQKQYNQLQHDSYGQFIFSPRKLFDIILQRCQNTFEFTGSQKFKMYFRNLENIEISIVKYRGGAKISRTLCHFLKHASHFKVHNKIQPLNLSPHSSIMNINDSLMLNQEFFVKNHKW